MAAQSIDALPFKRGLLAALFVATLAGAVEWISIHQGGSTAIEVAFLAIPAAAAFLFFRTWRTRLAAWALLTALSYATLAAVVVGYWYS